MCAYALRSDNPLASRWQRKQTVQKLDCRLGGGDQCRAPDDAERRLETGSRRRRTRRISLIKFFGARVLHDVIDRAIQVHGALGYSKIHRSRCSTATRAPRRVYDGPDEVHERVVAQRILKLFAGTAGRPPAQIRYESARANALVAGGTPAVPREELDWNAKG